MKAEEIFVIILLGVIGYWSTAAVIRHFMSKGIKEKTTVDASDHRAEYQQQGNFEKKQREQRNYVQEQSENLSWHDILGITANASIDEIKLAYKKKMSMYHPDKVSSLGPEFNEIAQRRSKEINTAYDAALKLKS